MERGLQEKCQTMQGDSSGGRDVQRIDTRRHLDRHAKVRAGEGFVVQPGAFGAKSRKPSKALVAASTSPRRMADTNAPKVGFRS